MEAKVSAGRSKKRARRIGSRSLAEAAVATSKRMGSAFGGLDHRERSRAGPARACRHIHKVVIPLDSAAKCQRH